MLEKDQAKGGVLCGAAVVVPGEREGRRSRLGEATAAGLGQWFLDGLDRLLVVPWRSAGAIGGVIEHLVRPGAMHEVQERTGRRG